MYLKMYPNKGGQKLAVCGKPEIVSSQMLLNSSIISGVSFYTVGLLN